MSIKIDNGFKTAVVDFDGLEKDICISWIDNAAIGDYILVHAGVAICTVDKTEAEATLKDVRTLSNNV